MKTWKVAKRYSDGSLATIFEEPPDWDELRDTTKVVTTMTASVTVVAGMPRVHTKLDRDGRT